MNKLSDIQQVKVREEYIASIEQNLIGPGSEKITKNIQEEIISEKPESRYSTGILYPPKEVDEGDNGEDVQEILEDNDKNEETVMPFIDNSFFPSSMGMTFYCLTEEKQLSITINTAIYEKINNPYFDVTDQLLDEILKVSKDTDELGLMKALDIDEQNKKIRLKNNDKEAVIDLKMRIENKDDDSIDYLTEDLKFFIRKISTVNYKNTNCYQREPLNFTLNLNISNEPDREILKKNNEELLEILCRTQNIYKNGLNYKAITIAVKNISTRHLFQTVLSVASKKGLKFIASEDISIADIKNIKYEDALNLLLYRDKKTYAFGRGVSVTWKEDDGRVTAIETTYIPKFELAPMSFKVDDLDDSILRVDSYINDVPEQIDKLNTFVDCYERWINEKKDSIASIGEQFLEIAQENISKCLCSVERMRKSIAFLESDKNAMKAFNLASEAMLLQRMSERDKKIECFKTKDYSTVDFTWRPFQLAFMLNALESMLNPESSERDDLDLIWVSTGGGKTEAYLYAIATVILYRRLSYENSAGVSVIMRYTLRLLTAQQFERASQLICALEFIRKNNNNLGDEEISIGLWIGEGTQNKLNDAKKTFDEMVKAHTLSEALKKNVFQVLKCPWCHEEHSILPREHEYNYRSSWGYRAVFDRNNYNMKCLNEECEFVHGLPLFVIDETIYEVRPSLLFGTVDKFAQVPLNENTANLFASHSNNAMRRPELVIQDELHLIAGPLGSIVGLYESALDYIMKDNPDNISPKYIASTATIRNAEEQVRSIFDRNVFQFPPNGLEASDNFFVKENKHAPGRKYIGVMATGKSQVTTEVRLMSLMLQNIRDLNLTTDEEELYWTIAGYFNSIRELGKAAGLIRDDVKEYINQLNKRNNTNKRNSYNNEELTSRINASEIPEILKKLETPHDEKGDSNTVVDTLIATNMLSVGVDIGRLNAMVVVGQPKLTAEYIQASSRVGRKSLGLVFTLYNSTKSRDRSHYETFHSYHQSLYKYVEASSVTPYSKLALKRAIGGIIVAMMRHTVEELSGDKNAIRVNEFVNELDNVKEYLIDRIKKSENDMLRYSDDARSLIDEFIDRWKYLSENFENQTEELTYFKYKMAAKEVKGNLLLKTFDNIPEHEEATSVMSTMRNVDTTAYLKIIE